MDVLLDVLKAIGFSLGFIVGTVFIVAAFAGICFSGFKA